MKYNREIEKKYVVTGASPGRVWERLIDLFGPNTTYSGVSTDTFWKQSGTDFIRLRRNTNELSVKITDKATIEDRVEENVVVKDFDTALRFATAVFGEPVGTLEKNFHVLEAPNFVIALYTVTGYPELYLEVEASNISIVTDVSDIITDHFQMRQEMRSLYQIIFGSKEAA